jgi:MFS family permease/quinol monooxygenase YgiN
VTIPRTAAPGTVEHEHVAAAEASAPMTPPAWAPLSQRGFRTVWFAFVGTQIVVWAQTVGAVDVISGQTASATLVALIQTAVSAPGVVLALIAGALADLVDRGRVVIAACVSLSAASAALAVTTVAGVATPAVVLVLMVVTGSGLAVLLPAHTALVPDLVSRSLLFPAIAINVVTVNAARAVGPAIAGALLAIASAAVLFGVLAGILAIVVLALARVALPRSVNSRPPLRGGLLAAAVTGARYARFSVPLRRAVARTMLFVLCASPLWAILPVVAERRLGLEASGFGALLACVGAGAIVGATVLPRARARLSLDTLITLSSLPVAGVLLLLPFVTDPLIAGGILAIGGAGWIGAVMGLSGAAQAAAPAWVRGRALAMWLLAYQAGLALGSVAWGLLADLSLQASLIVPAGGLLLTALVRGLLPLDLDERLELLPSGTWPAPEVAGMVDGGDGPVLVTVDYDVAEENVREFLAAMQDLAVVRRRDGARRWRLHRDLAVPGRFVEMFESATWDEHLQHHERSTTIDAPVEERATELSERFAVRHMVGVTGGLRTVGRRECRP